MTDYGLISIITPNYNCGKFVAETIRSVQAQTYTNWEMIIVDDCSTDHSISVIASFAKNDSRIKVYSNEANSGAAESRNLALRQAQGKWIAFLDSDDIWLPNKLEKQIEFMVKNDYHFSYTAYSQISEEGKDLGVYVSGKDKVSEFDMYSCCWPGCLTVMYDREKIGLVQINDVRKNNDTALWLKVIKKAPCYLLEENLARYRKRANSITPKSLAHRIWAHYPLFRVAEEMNPISASVFTLLNVLGNSYKKLFYIQNDFNYAVA